MRSFRPLLWTALPLAAAFATTGSAQAPPSAPHPDFDCAYRPPTWWREELRKAVSRGEVPDPSLRAIPRIEPRTSPPHQAGSGDFPCLTNDHVFPYEDSAGLLLTNFSNGQLIALMVDAANELMATHGDLYDFVGFWVNFDPHHLVGAAFYKPIENDVFGIGDPSLQGTPIFNFRPDLGLGGDNIEGFIMMWNVTTSYWQPGTGPGADFTRLALGQEFEHRWALFLPDLLDGRRLQGDNGSCGRAFHWSWKADGQGSCMEISEWEGSAPAVLTGSFVNFNGDTGGVFSWPDLYLMGYTDPAETDAGYSEFRYMDLSNCSTNYLGPISTVSVGDIVASAGERVPDAAGSQHHFRAGWIMIHQPGDPPSTTELSKAVAILEQHQVDWFLGTLGRGTMDDTLFDDCNCNGVPDSDDIAGGTSGDVNGNGIPDECEECGSLVPYCVSSPNSAGPGSTIDAFGSTSVADNDFHLSSSGNPPGQLGLFYYGPAQAQVPFGEGFRCVAGGGIGLFRLNPPLPIDSLGDAVRTVDFTAPPASSGPGRIEALSTWNFQFWYRDPAGGGSGFNLSDAISVSFCP